MVADVCCTGYEASRNPFDDLALRPAYHRMGNSVAQALEAFQSRTGESDRFTIEEGDDIRLRPKVALALGMAFHELATNAAKYGALSNGAGRVTLSWQLEPKADRLRVRWQESGGPPVKPPTRKGFGSRLIERGLA